MIHFENVTVTYTIPGDWTLARGQNPSFTAGNVVFFLILAVGYIYIWRKGVLDWGPEHDPEYAHHAPPGPALVKRYRYGTRD